MPAPIRLALASALAPLCVIASATAQTAVTRLPAPATATPDAIASMPATATTPDAPASAPATAVTTAAASTSTSTSTSTMVTTTATATSITDTAAPQATPTLDAVTVLGRHDPRRDDTATRIVVTGDELLQHGDLTLSDALKRLPGVTTGTDTGSGGRAIALRGMGGYTQILVNGQKAATGFDLDSLTPEMIERVEILRAVTADLSAEGIAGTLNIVLNQNARRDAWRSHALTATLSQRRTLYADSGVETGHDRYGNQVLRRDTRLHQSSRRDGLTLAPTLDLTLERGDRLALQARLDTSRLQRQTDIDWDTSLGPDLAHVRYRQAHDIGTHQLSGSATWTHPFERAGSLDSKASAAWNREDYHFTEQGFGADGHQNLDDDTRADMDVTQLGSSGKWSLPGSGRHRFELGWEGSMDRRRETRVQHLRPVGGSAGSISDLAFDARIRRLALYAQDDLRLSPRWSVYLGLRGEMIETRSDGDSLEPVRNRADVLSPVLQSLWKLAHGGKDQVRLALGRTYKSPTLASLSARPYTSTNNRPLDPDMRGNPGLRPELATGLDVAWEHHGTDGNQLSLGGYLRRIEGVVLTGTRLLDGRWVAFPDNRGDASARGLEMDARWRPVGVPDLDLRANATRNWSKVEDIPGPDNRLDEQLRFSASVGADWKAGADWTFGGSYSYRSGGPVRISLHRGSVAAWRRELDLYALWTLDPRSKLRLSAANLLGQTLVSRQWYQDADGGQRIDRLRRPPPSLRLQLEVQL